MGTPSLLHAALRALLQQPVTVELPAPYTPLLGTLTHVSAAELTLCIPPAPGAPPLPPFAARRGASVRVPLSRSLSIRVGGGPVAVHRALAARDRALQVLARRQGRGVGARRARGGEGGPRVGLAWALEPLGLDSGAAL